MDILQEELEELQELVPGSRENEYETILTFDSSLKKTKLLTESTRCSLIPAS